MSSRDLRTIGKLRAMLRRSNNGLGIAASFVSVFLLSKYAGERAAVRRILLGTPVDLAVSRLVSEGTTAGDLLKFIVGQGKISALEASRGAERLSSLFERWALLKERRVMEGRVMEFRGMVISAVMGIVLGMLSSLAPMISNFQISLTATQASSNFNPYEGALLLVPSAVALGFFLSPGRQYVHVLLSLSTFLSVVYFLGPLALVSAA